MRLKNLLLICLMFIFVTACAPETSDMTEAQIADSAEGSEAAQDVADEHSDEDSDEHSDEEGEHDAEDSDKHSDEEGEHDAEDEHEEGNERRELGAHEHGAAELMIAWSGSDVAIDLETPAYNILGFEYAPTSDEEKALLEENVVALEAGGLLELNPAAECTLVAANVETKFSEDHDEEGHDEDEEGESEEGHDEEGESEEGHDEEGESEEGHDEEGESEEGHDEEGHDEEGHSEETHSDIDISYNLECGAPENIESLDASNLFAQFPNFEEIQVQWISDTEQSATDLTSDNPVLAFK